MRSEASTVAGYLKSLPEERRAAISALRAVVCSNLPKGYEETMNWGMISYEVPLAVEPKTYNGKPLMYAAIASQKNHMALYLCSLYCLPGAEKTFTAAWKKSGKKLDMGKSCIRFRKLEDLDLGLIGATIAATPVADFVKVSRRSHK